MLEKTNIKLTDAANAEVAIDLACPELLKSKCYVNGAWIGTPLSAVFNPATGIQIGTVPEFGGAEAVAAVEAAAGAYASWSAMMALDRAKILKKWAYLVLKHKSDLALILTSEQGKPLAEAISELESSAGYLEFYAEEARRIHGEIIPSPRSSARILVIKQSIGVVAAITPWNFPSSMVARKISPALAAGCTVVLKPARETPLSALALAFLAEQAGLPRGVFNVITGKAREIGGVLTSHEKVRVISFTGSTVVGKLLYGQAAVGMKKVALELGGNAPFIVFEDADIEAAVEGVIASKFRNAGQTCVCANRIYVHSSIHDMFVEALVERVRDFRIGLGTDEGVNLGPLINVAAVGKVQQHVADAVSRGAKIRIGGGRHSLGDLFFEPTVLTDVKSDALVMREETFGPVAPICKFENEREVIDLANATPFDLAGYFYSQNLRLVWRVAEALQCGMVGVNTGIISTEVAPFGGIKESGLGREGSSHGILEYVELKYVMMAGI